MRPSGLEPEFTVWKTAILPLNYKRSQTFVVSELFETQSWSRWNEQHLPNLYLVGLTQIRTGVRGVRIPCDNLLHYETLVVGHTTDVPKPGIEPGPPAC